MHVALLKDFENRFNKKAERVFFCPGRVNLIGEHIDYNGGKVLPCAIDRGTWLAIGRNTGMKLNFQSLNFPEKATLNLQSSYTRSGKSWFNYPLGMINQLLNEGAVFSGIDLLFYSDLPIGAGLSSSASLTVLTGYSLDRLFELSIPKKEIAMHAKKVENEFIGINCGIMDQIAVAMGKKDHAILLDCESLEMKFLPFESDVYTLMIINTRKERQLVDSKYNERFRECAAALSLFKKELPIHSLCDLNKAAFELNQHLIIDPILKKRARHVVSENERVRMAAIALEDRDLARFGQLMFDSHISLAKDYEVSCSELDTIVDFCRDWKGCAGARMTGAGFGGSAIALIERNRLTDFSIGLGIHYEKMIGWPPDIFAVQATDGVRSAI